MKIPTVPSPTSGTLNAASLSKIDFAHTFHWDILFPDYSTNWIPASIVQDDAMEFEVSSLKMGPTEAYYPILGFSAGFSMTIFDDDTRSFTNFMMRWKEKIMTDDGCVYLLGHDEVVKRAIIMDLNYDRSPISWLIRDLMVVPKEGISFQKDSSSGAVTLQCSFACVGIYN